MREKVFLYSIQSHGSKGHSDGVSRTAGIREDGKETYASKSR